MPTCYRRACLNAIEYLKVRLQRRAGLCDSRHGSGGGHISGIVDINACATLWVPTEIFDFNIRPNEAGPIKQLKGNIDLATVG
jgi:formamidase